MRTITLIPSHLGVSPGRAMDRDVGILTLVGAGELADVQLEVILDPASLAALEAGVSDTRDELRRSTSAR